MSRYADLDRPPLSERALAAALVRPGGLWTSLRVVTETGSTNDDLAAAAAAGATEGAVLVAELQTAGRGRVDRAWASPAQSGLTFSVLLRPVAPVARWGWLPLLGGVALADAAVRVAGVEAGLKWPNDLLLGPRRLKGAGILARVAGGAVVVGMGCNVSTRTDELPPGAASLATVGAESTDRDPLLRAVLRGLADGYRRWTDAGGDAEACGLAADYRARCLTLGGDVTVTRPDGSPLVGRAEDVDADGRLVVATATGRQVVAAGDVTHVRPTRPATEC